LYSIPQVELVVGGNLLLGIVPEGMQIEAGHVYRITRHIGFHEHVATRKDGCGSSGGSQDEKCLENSLFKARASPASEFGSSLLHIMRKVSSVSMLGIEVSGWVTSKVNDLTS